MLKTQFKFSPGIWKEASDKLEAPTSQADLATSVSLLRLCASSKNLAAGKRVHDHITKNGNEKNTFLRTVLLQMYLKCGAVDDAQKWFDKMHERNVLSWNVMIGEHVRQGQLLEAIQLFEQMQQQGVVADKITLIYMLSACTSSDTAKQMHTNITLRGFELDIFVGTALVTAFSKCGSLEEAQKMFDKMIARNVVSWNAMLAAYAQIGWGKEAVLLFNQMQQEGMLPDKVTFISVLSACASWASLSSFKQMHTYILCCRLDSDTVVATALVNMYGKCGCLNDARLIFNTMHQRQVVLFNAMIAVYAQQGQADEAFQIFNQMHQEGLMTDNVTFVSLLDACSSQAALRQGKRLHLMIIHSRIMFDLVVATALVNMYGKCGNLDDARMIFDNMPYRNVISWNAMIAAYAQYGHGRVALELFHGMQGHAMNPNKVTSVEIFSACASQTSIAQGKIMHSCIMPSALQSDVFVANAVLNMYGKCGSLEDAKNVFDKMPDRNGSSWNAMIAAYAQHGDGKKAVELFKKMQHDGVTADDITFVSILAACSHAGLVDEGHYYLVSMNRDHGVIPTVEHYDCVIDMLCRAGLLDEAEDLVKKMPCKPSMMSWTTMLRACRNQVDVERGNRAAKQLLDLDWETTASYIMLSSIYAAAGRDHTVETVMKIMRGKLKKGNKAASHLKHR